MSGGVPCGIGAAARLVALSLGLSLSLVLAGCFSAKDPNAHCSDISEYQQSTSVPDITIPEGLTAPGQASSYTVPPAAADQALQGAACLARPPDYFRKDPAAAPAAAPAPPAK
ncbi:MAG: hypothetical protein ABI567_06510 [Gammaproteobacteria bacterium]